MLFDTNALIRGQPFLFIEYIFLTDPPFIMSNIVIQIYLNDEEAEKDE